VARRVSLCRPRYCNTSESICTGEKVRFTQQFSLEHIGELVLVPAAPVHLDPQRASERFEFKLRDLEAECLGTCAHIIDSVVLAPVGLPVRALVSIDCQLVHSSQ
jgi:hypothetical protein